MKLNLRDLFWLVLVVAMGLGWWTHYQSFAGGLYKDADIKSLESTHAAGSDNEGRAYLVVENGDSRPRSEVFSELGISDLRLRDFRAYVANGDCTLLWQISPSYDIACRTVTIPSPLLMSDPTRKIYGVQIRERAEHLLAD